MNEKTADTVSKGYGYFRLGLTDLANECFETAIEEITKNLSSSADNATDHYFRATLKYEIGDYDGVVSDLDIAIRVDPYNPTYYDLRGLSNFRLCNYSEATRDFRMAAHSHSEPQLRHQAALHLQLTENWVRENVR